MIASTSGLVVICILTTATRVANCLPSSTADRQQQQHRRHQPQSSSQLSSSTPLSLPPSSRSPSFSNHGRRHSAVDVSAAADGRGSTPLSGSSAQTSSASSTDQQDRDQREHRKQWVIEQTKVHILCALGRTCGSNSQPDAAASGGGDGALPTATTSRPTVTRGNGPSRGSTDRGGRRASPGTESMDDGKPRTERIPATGSATRNFARPSKGSRPMADDGSRSSPTARQVVLKAEAGMLKNAVTLHCILLLGSGFAAFIIDLYKCAL